MSRHFIIDGHNCLMSGGEFFSLPRKDAFVDMLLAYTREKDLRVTVVFDSRSPVGSVYSERIGRLDIIYPDSPDEADDLILDLIRRGSPGRDTWVVSSDRKIQRGARAAGLKVMESIEFKDFLRAKTATGKNAEARQVETEEKPQGPGPGEIEEYMRKFGADEE